MLFKFTKMKISKIYFFRIWLYDGQVSILTCHYKVFIYVIFVKIKYDFHNPRPIVAEKSFDGDMVNWN